MMIKLTNLLKWNNVDIITLDGYRTYKFLENRLFFFEIYVYLFKYATSVSKFIIYLSIIAIIHLVHRITKSKNSCSNISGCTGCYSPSFI